MSTYVRPYSETSGTIAYASSVNKYVDDLVSTVNAINSANIITSGVDSPNLNACAVTNGKIADGAVDADKIDGEVSFYREVFS